jgi:sugar phosphate isomerase/epimerase
LPKAEECGVVLALENHWGLTRTAAGVLRIVKSINSEWLRALLDCGNFLDAEDIYDSINKIASFAALVHAKTYFGGGEWYSLDIDYSKVAEILKAVNFRGYISIEFEGKEKAETGVAKSVELLREAIKGKGRSLKLIRGKGGRGSRGK